MVSKEKPRAPPSPLPSPFPHPTRGSAPDRPKVFSDIFKETPRRGVGMISTSYLHLVVFTVVSRNRILKSKRSNGQRQESEIL